MTHICVDFFLFFAGRLDDFYCEASGNAGLLVLSTEVERVGFRESNQIELRGFNPRVNKELLCIKVSLECYPEDIFSSCKV